MNTRVAVQTTDAPAAIGPYSQAIVCGEFVFTSGQVALDPATAQLVGADVAAQTARVLANLAAVLEKAGSSLADVVRTTVYLRDMADFAAMNAVYAASFHGTPPARSTVAVAGLPKDARVEIDAIARVRRA
ncbi:MAG TPA: Rid family detoxifying hydrolase [Planctomycetota bacterium]|nr:Rid family detoxifying hydrolase [Planctomycetota bacterium]